MYGIEPTDHIFLYFSIDKDSEGSDAESEHIFARMNQDSLKMSQVAHNYWNVGMSIVEEF